MGATSTAAGPTVTLTPNHLDALIGILGLGGIVAFLGYAAAFFPNWVAFAGIGAALTTVVAYLIDEFVPATWVEYLAVVIVGAVVGEVANLSSVPHAELIAGLTIGLGIASAVYKSISDSGGSVLNPQQETYALAITGAIVAFLSWWSNNPTATSAVVVVTLITTIGQFVRVSNQAAPTSA
jgi:hypothetical protein